jgi:hypothetical protein
MGMEHWWSDKKTEVLGEKPVPVTLFKDEVFLHYI